MDVTFPPDRFPGCLERAEPFGKLFAKASDNIEIVPEREWPELQRAINEGRGLRPFIPEVLDQDGAGSCATESTAMAVMSNRVTRGLPHVLLNPWFIYYHTGGKSDFGNGRGGGSSIDTNLKFAMDNGIAPMSKWPRSRGWRTKPSQEAYDAALEFRIKEVYDIENYIEAGSALVKGFGIVYGARGHSVFKIALNMDVNSWGSNWKDGGFGEWASLRNIDFRYGAFAVRVA